MNLDSASDQLLSPKVPTNVESSVQSASIPKSAELTRRFEIFKSITASTDQRHDDVSLSIEHGHSSSSAEDSETVNEILQHSLVDLTSTLQILGTNDPSKAMRIPVHVTPMQSPESLLVFQSLLMMLSNPKELRSLMPWQQYLSEAIRKHQCSEVELCREFHQNFKCDEEGHLEIIMLNARGSFDHLNLLMIPNTVKTLMVKRAQLKTISDWTDLKGKSLKVLQLNENNHLELKLEGLRGELNHLPLQHLVVSTGAMADSFGEKNWGRASGTLIGRGEFPIENWERALSKIGNWMKTSTLTSLTLRARGQSNSKGNVSFDSDGAWKIDGRSHSGNSGCRKKSNLKL